MSGNKTCNLFKNIVLQFILTKTKRKVNLEAPDWNNLEHYFTKNLQIRYNFMIPLLGFPWGEAGNALFFEH